MSNYYAKNIDGGKEAKKPTTTSRGGGTPCGTKEDNRKKKTRGNPAQVLEKGEQKESKATYLTSR